jgi:hypothetical protein
MLAAKEEPFDVRSVSNSDAFLSNSSIGAPSDMKAGSMMNSPSAKLIVPEACHSSVKPSAASA